MLDRLTKEPVAHIRRKLTHAVGQLAGITSATAEVRATAASKTRSMVSDAKGGGVCCTRGGAGTGCVHGVSRAKVLYRWAVGAAASREHHFVGILGRGCGGGCDSEHFSKDDRLSMFQTTLTRLTGCSCCVVDIFVNGIPSPSAQLATSPPLLPRFYSSCLRVLYFARRFLHSASTKRDNNYDNDGRRQ